MEMSRRPAVLSSSSCQTYTVDVGRSNERKRIGNEYVYCPRWCISWHTLHAAKTFAASRRSCMFEPSLGHLLITSAHVQAIKPTLLGSVGLVQAIRTVSTVQGVTRLCLSRALLLVSIPAGTLSGLREAFVD